MDCPPQKEFANHRDYPLICYFCARNGQDALKTKKIIVLWLEIERLQ
jgi:hypothetical protein